MKSKILISFVIVVLSGVCVEAQTYDTNGVGVQTFAGSGQASFANGVGQQAKFNYPVQVVGDSKSNLFFLDSSNGQIRKIAPDSTVSTFVALSLGTDGKLTIARNDNIFALTGYSPFRLYKISSNGTFTFTNLGFLSASPPGGLCMDSSGYIYISDQLACIIYRCDTNGVATVFAGSGSPGNADLNGTNAAFNSPLSLACDTADNIYVWERGNSVIRRIDQSRNVTTYAGSYGNFGSSADGVGTNAVFGIGSSDAILQMCCDRFGNLFLACDWSVRKISATTNVTTLAGSFTGSGYVNGQGNVARFNRANGICLSGDTIYIADMNNQRIRSITNNPPPQIVSPSNLQLGTYPGLQITGTVGRTYKIQTSPDMNTWTTKATILLTSSPYLWVDQNPVSESKFYRAFLLP